MTRMLMNRPVASGAACLALVLGLARGVFAADVLAPASERFADRDIEDAPDFQKHIVPLLGRLGCNGSQCHGSFQGKGDFRLSLFGYDFENDLEALTAEATSEPEHRVQPDSPAESLVVLKPTMQVDHGGGRRFEVDSWEHRLLLRWIEAGARGTASHGELARLEVDPPEIVFGSQPEPVELVVIAEWRDGTREDVTCLCRFQTNDDAVVLVDRDGRATSTGRGDTHIVAFYDNGVAAVPVLRPVTDARPAEEPGRADSEIDRFVAAKLGKLGIAPSPRSSDAEFLRRVSLDLTGTLPSPDEVESFLADRSEDKRGRKIDELLERPAYAAWWANKLCDFTGCSPTALTEVVEVGQAMAAQWYDWIYRRVADNMPYDELVEGIVLASGRGPDQSRAEYAAEMSSYVRRESPADFAERETMPHYWTRASVKEPKEKALAFAHSFLGIQLQCAQCHKHPFDQWTQGDFREFAAFFEEVGVDGKRVGFPEFAAAQAGQTIGWPALVIEDGDEETLSLLRSREVSIGPTEDPRAPIMDWMRERSNPWFARAFVNRVWASYYHVGIVDPPDAITPANPPSNPQLLDWLTEGFVASGYDMKWLHRQIVTSETYQRSWKPNETNRDDRRNFSRAIPRRIPAEVMYDAIKQATAATDRLDEVRSDLTRRASGHLSMRMAGTYAMNVFGKPDRSINCDCERSAEPTLLQSIFLQNDPLIRMRLAESGWVREIADKEKIDSETDRSRLIREAWLRTVGRPPTAAEVARADEHLESTDSLAEGITDLLWALINTKEFVLNH